MKIKETLCRDTPPAWFLDTLGNGDTISVLRVPSVHYRLLVKRVKLRFAFLLRNTEPK